MPPVVRALIFMAIGAGLQAIVCFAILPPLIGISGGGMVALGLIGMIGAGVFGFVTGFAGIYEISPRSIWVFVLDVTWSALNTVTGLFFLIWCAVKGGYQSPTEDSKARGVIHYTGAALGGAGATTIGTVMGGTWMVHELVHVQQARIFGPFYWPTYLLSYFLNMLSRFITGRFTDPHWQAYGRVLMEDWAYRSAPSNSILIGQWVLWFFLTLVNVLAVAVLFAPIPVAGAIPAVLGMALIPWWVRLIVLFAYALVRSFLAKASEEVTGLSFH